MIPGAEQAFECLPERLLVGFSGGADSTALMRLLLCQRGPAGLWAVHVNHGLRGDASDADEAFVRACCAEWGVPLLTFRASPPPAPGEGWAREARWAFFRQAMAETGAQALVLAHHRDDQTETVLLRLLRGSGLRGLGGMAEDTVTRGVRVMRPLLSLCGHEELCAWLRSIGQGWREDASNADSAFLRNRVRHKLVPLMEALQPGFNARTAGMAEGLRQDEHALEALAGALYELYPDGSLRLSPLTGQPEALVRRALRRWWREQGGEALPERALSQEWTARLTALAQSGGAGDRLTLPGGRTAARGWKALHLLPDAPPPPGEEPLTDAGAALNGVRLILSPAGSGECGLPAGLLEECRLRTRRPGDWLRTGDGAHRRKLQDFLVDAHVDAPWRERLPLLCRGGEVLSVPGLYAGGLSAAAEEGGLLRVTWEGSLPWTED